MPLNQFKMQVLLLHSEQSTLDELSAGFSDDYTVHCATSGSEALNTLVETPINVLVSAQELPGMSGLDALREAKKRSPDMIGILLAGDAGQEVEALVGSDELFQVVRGNVTSESLLKLVDKATRQMRLMALTHSANDTTANVDQPAEHIVMETSENGSAIISDGTGRMAALDPKKIAAAASIGSRAVDVLVLTKDQEFLETIKASSRGMHKVFYANTLAQADEAIRNHKIGVGVVDAAMVGEKIEQLTQHLRKGSPRLVCIVAGRRDDGEMLMDLINRGKVYRFLMKPVSPGRARLAVEASVRHHLEAPDVAFKTKGRPAIAKPATKLKPPVAAAAVQKDPPLGSAVTAANNAPAVDDSSLVETVKDLVSAIGKTFTGDKKPQPDAIKIPDPTPRPTSSSGGSGSSVFKNPKFLGAGAIAIIAIAGTLFFALGGSDESAEPQDPAFGTPRISEADVVFDPLPVAQPAADVDVDAVIEQALGEAETAMLAAQLDVADAALLRVAAVDAENTRLPFLAAQLEQLKLRNHLDNARVAIREDRFEDAATSLRAARSLSAPETTQLDAVASELATARSDQRVEDVLAKAAARVEADALLSPANDNARYYYELVLSNDPQNATARQGLNVIASKLALRARNEIDTGNLNAAGDLLETAAAIDAANSEVELSTAMLAISRAKFEERAVAAKQAAAVLAESQAESLDESQTELQTELQTESQSDSPAESETDSPPASSDPEASSPEVEIVDTEIGPPVSAANPEPAVTQINERPVPVSSLRRIRYVAPKYPRSAQRRNQSGWVDIVFIVATDGSVKDIEVRKSEPGDTFVASATRAVTKWEFEPIIKDGTAVEVKAGVRMMFALE